MNFETIPYIEVKLTPLDLEIAKPSSGLHGETVLHAKYLDEIEQNALEIKNTEQQAQTASQAMQIAESKLHIRPNSEIGPVTYVEYLLGEKAILEAEKSKIVAEKAVEEANYEALLYKYMHDSLTGALNNEGFGHALEVATLWALETPEEEDDNNVMLVMETDLDKFKTINDTHGHPAGNAILRHFASVFEKSARRITRPNEPHDTIARVGGDEFYIIMSRVNKKMAPTIVNHLRARVNFASIPYKTEEGQTLIQVGVSVGAIMVPYIEIKRSCINSETGEIEISQAYIEEVLKAADRSMYEEKIRRHGDKSSR